MPTLPDPSGIKRRLATGQQSVSHLDTSSMGRGGQAMAEAIGGIGHTLRIMSDERAKIDEDTSDARAKLQRTRANGRAKVLIEQAKVSAAREPLDKRYAFAEAEFAKIEEIGQEIESLDERALFQAEQSANRQTELLGIETDIWDQNRQLEINATYDAFDQVINVSEINAETFDFINDGLANAHAAGFLDDVEYEKQKKVWTIKAARADLDKEQDPVRLAQTVEDYRPFLSPEEQDEYEDKIDKQIDGQQEDNYMLAFGRVINHNTSEDEINAEFALGLYDEKQYQALIKALEQSTEGPRVDNPEAVLRLAENYGDMTISQIASTKDVTTNTLEKYIDKKVRLERDQLEDGEDWQTSQKQAYKQALDLFKLAFPEKKGTDLGGGITLNFGGQSSTEALQAKTKLYSRVEELPPEERTDDNIIRIANEIIEQLDNPTRQQSRKQESTAIQERQKRKEHILSTTEPDSPKRTELLNALKLEDIYSVSDDDYGYQSPIEKLLTDEGIKTRGRFETEKGASYFEQEVTQ